MSPNLGWRDEPLGERLAEALGTDVPVTFANESDLAALAEHRRGAAIGVDDVVLIWGSIGVGGGLIIDGAPLVGDAGYGGEVGHIPVNPDGLPCRCGSFGCWETEVGGNALLRRAGYPPEAGTEAMRHRPRRRRGRRRRWPWRRFAETGRWLGIGLAGIINVLNPRLVAARQLPGRRLSVHPLDPPGRARPAGPAGVAPHRARRADGPRRRCAPARRGRARLRTPAQRPGGVASAPPPCGRPCIRLTRPAKGGPTPRTHPSADGPVRETRVVA